MSFKSVKKLMIGVGASALSMAYVVPAYAGDVEDPWLIRLRALNIVPDESAEIDTIGGEAEISNRVVPELDISYFFTENIAAELILATNPHDVSVRNSSLGDVDLGDVTLLPPTINLQYHFNPRGAIRPYLGAGVNYTFFYDNDPGDAVSVNYDNTFGLSLQAGADIPVNDTYFFNLDVKKVFLSTDVNVNAGAAGRVAADVDIDPWIFGVGVGRRF
jgi:outer membrane protein